MSERYKQEVDDHAEVERLEADADRDREMKEAHVKAINSGLERLEELLQGGGKPMTELAMAEKKSFTLPGTTGLKQVQVTERAASVANTIQSIRRSLDLHFDQDNDFDNLAQFAEKFDEEGGEAAKAEIEKINSLKQAAGIE